MPHSTLAFDVTVEKAGSHRHAHQVRKTIGRHLGHKIGAVDLNGTGTDPKIERDDLICVSRDKTFEHLPFAIRQRRQFLLDVGQLGFLFGRARFLAQCVADRFKLEFVVKWLFEKLNRPQFHRFHRHRYIAMTSDDNHWHVHPAVLDAAQ